MEQNETAVDKPIPGTEASRNRTSAGQGDMTEETTPAADSKPAVQAGPKKAAPPKDTLEEDGDDEIDTEEDEDDKTEDEEDELEEEDDEDDEPQGGRMSLTAHLAELRKRLIICVACFLVCFSLCLSRAEWFTDLLLTRGSYFTFVYIAPAELLMSYIRIALMGGLIITIPVIVYHVWQFVKPGLRRRERLGFSLIMTLGLLLFCLGALFAFAIVLPILLAFFARLDTTNTVNAMVSVQEYISYVISTMLTFGIIFETPIVLVALTSAGLVKPQFLQKNFKFVVLIILTLSAVITPPDVTSQVLVAVPLMVLFYASIILCKILFRRKLAREAAEEAELAQ